MKDNYGDSGKTISRKSVMLNQDQNSLITPKVQTSQPSAQVTSTPATPVVATTSTFPITQEIPVRPSLSPSGMQTQYPSANITANDTPSPLKTKTVGFEAILSGTALIIGLVLIKKK
jgi:hypothetical protein